MEGFKRLLRVLDMLKEPTPEMMDAGMAEIFSGASVEYASNSAPKHVLHAMLRVAVERSVDG